MQRNPISFRLTGEQGDSVDLYIIHIQSSDGGCAPLACHAHLCTDGSGLSAIAAAARSVTSRTTIDTVKDAFGTTSGQIFVPLNGQRSVGSWTGSGYFELWNANNSLNIGYLLSGGYHGGFATAPDFSNVDGGVFSVPATAQQSRASATSAEPINLVEGSYTYDHQDIDVGSVATAPFGMTLTRSYDSSRSTESTALGNGWRHNFMMTAAMDSDSYEAFGDHNPQAAVPVMVVAYVLEDLSNAPKPVLSNTVVGSLAASWMMDQLVNNAVTLTLNDGTRKFIKIPLSTGSTYVAPPGDASTINVNADQSIVLTDRSKIIYTFDQDGKIVSWKDPNGNALTFSYTGTGPTKALQAVSNGMGRSLTFTYNGGQLATVSNGTATVTYGYNAGLLTTFTNQDAKSTTFTYEPSGRLASIYFPSFPTTPFVTNTYDALGQVMTQSDAFGNVWTYLFANGERSEEIDPTGASHDLYFDNNGNNIVDIDQMGSHDDFEALLGIRILFDVGSFHG